MSRAGHSRGWRRQFERRFACRVLRDEPLADHTTLRVGGPAALMAWLDDARLLLEARTWLQERKVPWRVLGGGSNVLVADSGFPGAVLRLDGALAGLKLLQRDSRRLVVEAGGGLALARLVGWAARHRAGGLECLWGIPGTVGGAVRGNAGTRLGSIADSLLEVLVAERGRRRWLSAAGLGLAYRRSRIGPRRVVLAARFRLRTVSERSLQRARQRARQLRRAQPATAGTAGCFFRNPADGRPAGWLIERAGLRGACRGAARVSERHANFLVNSGGASARQVWELARLVARQVRRVHGVRLEPEVERWGDFSSPGRGT